MPTFHFVSRRFLRENGLQWDPKAGIDKTNHNGTASVASAKDDNGHLCPNISSCSPVVRGELNTSPKQSNGKHDVGVVTGESSDPPSPDDSLSYAPHHCFPFRRWHEKSSSNLLFYV